MLQKLTIQVDWFFNKQKQESGKDWFLSSPSYCTNVIHLNTKTMNLERLVGRRFIVQAIIGFTVIWSYYGSCLIDIQYTHVAQKTLDSL